MNNRLLLFTASLIITISALQGMEGKEKKIKRGTKKASTENALSNIRPISELTTLDELAQLCDIRMQQTSNSPEKTLLNLSLTESVLCRYLHALTRNRSCHVDFVEQHQQLPQIELPETGIKMKGDYHSEVLLPKYRNTLRKLKSGWFNQVDVIEKKGYSREVIEWIIFEKKNDTSTVTILETYLLKYLILSKTFTPEQFSITHKGTMIYLKLQTNILQSFQAFFNLTE